MSINKMCKGNTWNWRRHQQHLSPNNKGILLKIYKEVLKIKNETTDNSREKWAKHLNMHFTKGDNQVAIVGLYLD